MLARFAAAGMVVVLQGCDALDVLPTGPSFSVHPLALGTTYYVDPAGDDENSGTSPDEAWRTLDKVSSVTLEPGDQVLFRAGQVFHGTLLIHGARVMGRAGAPVRFASFGDGQATIRRVGQGRGIHAVNTSYITVEDLNVDGVDRMANTAEGVFVEIRDRTHHGFIFRNVAVYGWGGSGMLVQAHAWPGSGDEGALDGVWIENVHIHTCRGQVGLGVWGERGGLYNVRNVTLRDIRVNDVIGTGWKWSGSGIFINRARDVLAEFCEVWDCGAQSGDGTNAGGPFAMWMGETRNGVFRWCEAHHNTAGGRADGGAFDFDGDCQDCVIEYCYSHDNRGPAILFANWHSENLIMATERCTFRYCISENDGWAPENQGLISVYPEGSDTAARMKDLHVYGNTFVVTQTSGTPLVYINQQIGGGQAPGLFVRNNIFRTAGGRRFIRSQSSSPGVMFEGNDWHAPAGVWEVDWNSTIYRSLAEWRNGTGQEMLDGQAVGVDVDPLLNQPGGGGKVGPRALPAALPAYRLQPGSPMPAAGVDLKTLYSSLPPHDFYGNEIPVGGVYLAVGADSGTQAPREPEPQPGPPKMHSLQDTFAGTTLNAEVWEASSSMRGAVVQADRLELRLASGAAAWAACTSRNVYDLTGSQAAVEAAQVVNSPGVFTRFMLRYAGDDTNFVTWAYEPPGLLVARRRAGGTSPILWSAPYHAVEHRWWRIRESEGEVIWETSADGSKWVRRYSEALPIDLSALEMQLYVERRGQTATAQTAIFDNVNSA